MQIIQSGPFEIGYQNGFLRQIKHEGVEVLRMMYFALRDHNWGTFAQLITNEVVDCQEDSFFITYTSTNVNEEQVAIFEWNVRIHGENDGTITFEIQGETLQAVRRNRAGFSILHPIQGTAEQPVTIFHEGDVKSQTHFPRYIAAQDPFLNIRAMQWQVANGAEYRLDFEGDVFQTEDQRNWGDASYKTFCTPLSRPFPVQLQPGDKVWQRVSLRSMSLPAAFSIQPSVEKKEPPQNRFQLGIAASVETERLPDMVAELLKSLDLGHYRIDLVLSDANWITKFSTHCENVTLLNLPLEIALFLADTLDTFEIQVDDFLGICKQNNLKIKHLLLFSAQQLVTPQALIDYIPSLKQQLPNTKIGVGTDYNFTELNRNRFEVGKADFVSFSFDPQEHAFDDWSLLENTESVLYSVESAEKLYGKPVHLSYISLRKRANPYATNPIDLVLSIEKQIDIRQKTNFAEEWTAKVLQYLSQTNVVSVTMFRTVGELGIMGQEGVVYPVFETLSKR